MQKLQWKEGKLFYIYIYNCLTIIHVQVVRERKILEVNVDKGMVDGQKITFSGEGDQEPGLEPGDIIIVLDEREHRSYKYEIILQYFVIDIN